MKYLDSMSDIFASQSSFLTRLLTSDILFSTALKAAAVAKPVILGMLPSVSVILVL